MIRLRIRAPAFAILVGAFGSFVGVAMVSPEDGEVREVQLVESGRSVEGGGSHVILRMPPGYASNDERRTALLKIHALYPEMEQFQTEKRAQWFVKAPDGSWGAKKPDVFEIFLTHSSSGENDASRGALKLLKRDLEKDLIGPAPFRGAGSPEHVEISAYTATGGDSGRVSTESLVLRSSDGRITVVRCYIGDELRSECVGLTTWQGVLSVRYDFPYSRLSEVTRIDTRVHRLIDSFKPTKIQSGSM